MGLLDGGIEAIFGAAFGGLYLDGTLHAGTGAPIYDAQRRITGYTDPGDVACKVQVDSASEAMRRTEGFAEGDVRLIILSTGLSADITSDHEVTARSVRYRLLSADRDAAASHWICRGRRA